MWSVATCRGEHFNANSICFMALLMIHEISRPLCLHLSVCVLKLCHLLSLWSVIGLNRLPCLSACALYHYFITVLYHIANAWIGSTANAVTSPMLWMPTLVETASCFFAQRRRWFEEQNLRLTTLFFFLPSIGEALYRLQSIYIILVEYILCHALLHTG